MKKSATYILCAEPGQEIVARALFAMHMHITSFDKLSPPCFRTTPSEILSTLCHLPFPERTFTTLRDSRSWNDLGNESSSFFEKERRGILGVGWSKACTPSEKQRCIPSSHEVLVPPPLPAAMDSSTVTVYSAPIDHKNKVIADIFTLVVSSQTLVAVLKGKVKKRMTLEAYCSRKWRRSD
ncbi:hypothetical protein SERLADRAFT_469124 [Serpula lacrymans var. lacrymans S7.9]|uniref:Uncharacterized protein n=1 Tax=Serpula lacrymans var. lacrymans (strain S7.9) TaxID=578457 RepID=F8NWM3_SERL9|nr:uncharacterized protein SERLADRAFT_469124 [Serpula lacrymans var. lacrymans S7.9]EGO25047.1 hypothetical protein SERLADRAFT_469124 [Serpula lacrymans var. lacrymans S7.9]